MLAERHDSRHMLRALETALGLSGASRISLHSLDAVSRTFEVVEYVGVELLANGSVLPIDAATQIMVPARGEIFCSPELDDDPRFENELDRLIKHLGFRSSCAIPLLLGRSPIGVLCVSSRQKVLRPEEVLTAVETLASDLTLALHNAPDRDSIPLAIICYQDAILGDWIARVIAERFVIRVVKFNSEDEATVFVQENPAESFKLIVCESFFGRTGLPDFLSHLRSFKVVAPAVVVASCDSPLSYELARLSRADAYVTRSNGMAGLLAAVEGCGAGSPFENDRAAGEGVSERLTRQECVLLLHLEEGKAFADIAREMLITVATAKSYARNLFRKFATHSRAETVFEARRKGVIDFLRGGGQTSFIPLSRGRVDGR